MTTVRIANNNGKLPRNLYLVNSGSWTETELWSDCSECGAPVVVARPHYRQNYFRALWTVTGSVVDPGSFLGPGTLCLCDSCVDKLTWAGDIARCDRCGTLTEEAQPIDGDGDFCRNCRQETATQCDECGDWVTEYVYISDIDEYYCESCADGIAYYCESCDRWVTENHWDGSRCLDCAEEEERLPDYHSARRNGFETFGSEPFIGRELEVERSRSSVAVGTMAREVCGILNDCGERVQVEHDGSLNNGFEMVFSPHGLDAWDCNLFARALNHLSTAGYRSHDPGTCGYHVHLSRLWFGDSEKKQARNIAHFVNAFNANYDTLVRIARRTTETAEHWSRRNDRSRYGEELTGSPAVKYCKSKKGGRYQAVNLENPHTVEIRLCRGSLKRESLEAWDDLIITMARNCHAVKYGVTDLRAWARGISAATADYIAGRTGLRLEV